MKHLRSYRERGASILVLLVPAAFLVLLAAALSTLAAANHRANTRSGHQLHAFYVADSGAQVGNAKVRSTGQTMQDTTFTESLAGGTADVVVQQLAAGLYKVTSTGTYEGESATVEIHVQFESATAFDLESGVSFAVGNGVQVDGDLRVILDGNPVISGFDHDANGVQLVDQTYARPALGVNALPGGKTLNLDLQLNSNPVIEGSPTDTANDNESQVTTLNDLRNHARDNADIFLSGNNTLTSTTYGTAASPVLVHYRASGGTLTLDSDFVGYGTLVVDAGSASNTVFEMLSNATWNGLVVVRFSGEPELGGSSSVVLDSNAKIVGGLGVLLTGEEIDIEGSGGILALKSNARVLHSRQLVSNAPGMDVVADPSTSSDVVSYRLK